MPQQGGAACVSWPHLLQPVAGLGIALGGRKEERPLSSVRCESQKQGHCSRDPQFPILLYPLRALGTRQSCRDA